MQYTYTAEQSSVADLTRELLTSTAPLDRMTRVASTPRTGPDESWSRIADAGLLGMLAPSDLGGGSGSLTDFAAFAEAAGAALLPGPWIDSGVSAVQAALARSDMAGEVLRLIVAGKAVAVFVEPGAARCTAGPEDGGLRVQGTARASHGQIADLAVLPATYQGQSALLLVSLTDVRRAPAATIDPLDLPARFEFDNLVGADSLLATGAAADDLIDRIVQWASAIRCVEMLGAARAVLDRAVDHVKTRSQFGRPVGSFQAIKHKLATAATDVENMAATAYWSLWAVQHGATEEAEIALAVSKAFCSAAYVRCCRAAVQSFGGIGFTWESGVHLYVKHARRCADSFGGTERHLERIATLLMGEL